MLSTQPFTNSAPTHTNSQAATTLPDRWTLSDTIRMILMAYQIGYQKGEQAALADLAEVEELWDGATPVFGLTA